MYSYSSDMDARLRLVQKVMDSMENIDKVKYWVCCPFCDKDRCMRGTDKCEAEQWKKMKQKEAERGK